MMRLPPLKSLLKAPLPRTLFGRSFLIIAVPVFLVQAVSIFVFFDHHWSRMTRKLAFAVGGEIAVIAGEIERNGTDSEEYRILATHAVGKLDLLVSFKKGETLAAVPPARNNSLLTRTLAREMDGHLLYPFAVRVGDREEWIEVFVQLPEGLLNVSVPQRRLFSSSGYVFLYWFTGLSVILFAIAILFMRNQIRPIRRLAIAADRFGKGRETPSFKPEGAREVRQAAQAFLDMRERIHRQISQRTAMLTGVSHDLRTPLTRMKLQLAILGDGAEIKDLQSDIADMERMIDGYLAFARGEEEEKPEDTDVSALLSHVSDGARRQGLPVDLSVEPNLFATLRPLAFERCLVNLTANAQRYGHKVWLSARRRKSQIEILVEDDGPGIPEERYEDVFKPFYRLETSRNAATGGVGLGLSIVMDIVHAHGGTITLGKSEHGGLCVRIGIPL